MYQSFERKSLWHPFHRTEKYEQKGYFTIIPRQSFLISCKEKENHLLSSLLLSHYSTTHSLLDVARKVVFHAVLQEVNSLNSDCKGTHTEKKPSIDYANDLQDFVEHD